MAGCGEPLPGVQTGWRLLFFGGGPTFLTYDLPKFRPHTILWGQGFGTELRGHKTFGTYFWHRL